MNVENEKYLSVKELSSDLKGRLGLIVSEQFVRSMLRAGVPRCGYYARISDLMKWWHENPSFSPRSKRKAA